MMDKALTKTIPIVCPLLADPERLGLIKSDARPGGNVTGLLEWVEGLPGKHLELVRDLIPSVTKIGLVVNPDNIHSLIQRRELETAAATKDIKIVSIEAPPQDVDSIFPTLSRDRVDAVIVLRDSMFYGERGPIAASAMAVRLPTVYGFREQVDAGGLISYGVSVLENFRSAAAAACTWSFAAFGQASDKRPRRIGYISAGSPVTGAQNPVAFLEGMRAHGYVEGRDIEIDYRWAEGHSE